MAQRKYDTEQARKQGAERLQRAKETLTAILENWKEDPAVLAEALAFRGKFHQYSMRNTALIYKQNPSASFVTSIRTWNGKGYRVKKGERGLDILFPQKTEMFVDASGLTKKVTSATADEKKQIADGTLRHFTHTGYRIGTVFDISQTDCPPEDYPKLYNMGYDSSQHAALYEAVKRFAEKNGYTVTETDKPDGLPSISLRGLHNGSTQEIAINDRMRDTQKLDTLIHEVGHSLLHRDGEGAKKPMAIKEVEADGVTIMLASALGIEVTDQRKRHFANLFEAANELEDFSLETLLPGIVSAFDTVWRGIEQEISTESELPKPVVQPARSAPQQIGARFDAEDMTQERYDAVIASGEQTPYFENLNFRNIKFPAEVGGRFVNCTFHNCDFSNTDVHAQFDKCSIYSATTEGAFFNAGFQHCTIANTGFQNSTVASSFSDVNIRQCYARNTAFNGCIFENGVMDRFFLQNDVTATNTQGLETVKITMGGATAQEIENHTRQIFEVLNADHTAKETEVTPAQAMMPNNLNASENAELPTTRETVVVNLFAGPGAGKTTCAWEIAEKLKKLGYVTEYVSEYAKELVWDGRTDLLDGTVAHQRMLCDEQVRRVDRLIGKVDFVVTDAPVLLNLSYLKEQSAAYEQEVLQRFNAHHNFCVFIERGKRFEKEGRIHDEQQSRQLDQSIKDMLETNDIYYGIYDYGTIDLCIENIQKTHARFNGQHSQSQTDVAKTAEPGKPRIFLDMDGTLARFHDDVYYLEHMYRPNFFQDLAPYANAVEGVKTYLKGNPEAEVFVLSALIDSPHCEAEKNAWLNQYLPEIDAEHRIFVKAGENKAEHIPGGIAGTDILIDDYNKNLTEWQQAGGQSVKYVNHINDKGSVGEMWKGDRMSYEMSAWEHSAALRHQIEVAKEQATAKKAEDLARQEYETMCHVIHQYEDSVKMPRDDRLVALQFDGNVASWTAKSGVSEEQLRAAVQHYGQWLQYGKEVDLALSEEWSFEHSHIVMGSTPTSLAKYGFDSTVPLMVAARKLRDIHTQDAAEEQTHLHGLPVETIKQLPAAIADPAIVMISATRPDDSLVLVSNMIDPQGRPIIISLRQGRGYVEAERIQANVMTSAYGRNDFNEFLQSALTQDRLLYVDAKNSHQLSQVPGVQFPDKMVVGDYTDNIARFRTLVNTQSAQNFAAYSSAPAAELKTETAAPKPVTQDTAVSDPVPVQRLTNEEPAPTPVPVVSEEPAKPERQSTRPRTTNQYAKQEDDTVDRIKQEIPIQRVIEACGYTLQRTGSHYNLKEHDSLMVYPDSNSFYRFSTQQGGSSIDFLMQMQGMSQAEAIRTLASQLTERPTPLPQQKQPPVAPIKKELELPAACSGKYSRAMAYLTQTRCIDQEVVSYLMRQKGNGSYLYQDDRNNVVFVGVNAEGNPAYACRRSTLTASSFKGDVKGSDGDVGWFVDHHASKLYVTEAAIDAMSLMTMRKEAGHAIDSASYLSLGGVSKITALENCLREHPEIREVVAACDRDDAGRDGNARIADLVKEQFPGVGVKIFDNFGSQDAKDLNEALCAKKQQEKQLRQNKDVVPPTFSKSREKGVEHE